MKPRLTLLGEDGNVFNIIAKARKAARVAGWEKERIDAFVADLMSSESYNEVLQKVMAEFEVD